MQIVLIGWVPLRFRWVDGCDLEGETQSEIWYEGYVNQASDVTSSRPQGWIIMDYVFDLRTLDPKHCNYVTTFMLKTWRGRRPVANHLMPSACRSHKVSAWDTGVCLSVARTTTISCYNAIAIHPSRGRRLHDNSSSTVTTHRLGLGWRLSPGISEAMSIGTWSLHSLVLDILLA